KSSTYGAHTRYTTEIEGKNSQVEFLVTAENNNMIYMFMPSSYERRTNLWLNKEFLDYYYEGGNMVIQTLGRFEPGEQFSLICTIANDKNEVLFKDKQFYWLDEEKFRRAVEELKKHPLEIELFEEDHLKGTITAEKDGIMFTTITNEPGWTIYVDGVKTEPVELYEALIGVPLTAGTHSIEMKFFPKGLAIGIRLSIAGLLCLVLIVILERGSRKKIAELPVAAANNADAATIAASDLPAEEENDSSEAVSDEENTGGSAAADEDDGTEISKEMSDE
ncbi:MAG: YfhO family protein, partial [Oscillospiraceae bacterium]|nr:YfhO family protein [Oscillospiraceae bacterium]